MFKYALKECKNHELNKVIVGCYKENIGSAKAIIKNNGKLIKEKNILLNINDCWRINLVDQFYIMKYMVNAYFLCYNYYVIESKISKGDFYNE